MLPEACPVIPQPPCGNLDLQISKINYICQILAQKDLEMGLLQGSTDIRPVNSECLSDMAIVESLIRSRTNVSLAARLEGIEEVGAAGVGIDPGDCPKTDAIDSAGVIVDGSKVSFLYAINPKS